MENVGFQTGKKSAVYVKLSFTAYTVFSKQHFLLCFKPALWLTYKVLLKVFFLNPTRVGSLRVQLEKGNLGS